MQDHTFPAKLIGLFGLGSDAASSLASSAVARMLLPDASEARLSMGTAMLVVFVGLVLARGLAKNVMSSSSLAIVVCSKQPLCPKNNPLGTRRIKLPFAVQLKLLLQTRSHVNCYAILTLLRVITH